MSNLKKVSRLIKKATKKEQQDLVNYHYSVEQVKQQKKANDLIKPSQVELFETLKTNLIILNDMKQWVWGFCSTYPKKDEKIWYI